MIIFLLSLLGLGRHSDWGLTGSVSSISLKTSLNSVAMFLCCGRLQWFSMDRMSGYLQQHSHHVCTLNFLCFKTIIVTRFLYDVCRFIVYS